MGGQYSVKETKEAVSLGFAIVGAALRAKTDDGAYTWSDWTYAMAVLPRVGPAIEGIGTVLLELKELDEADVKELMDHSAAELSLAVTDPSLQTKVLASLELVAALSKLYQALKPALPAPTANA